MQETTKSVRFLFDNRKFLLVAWLIGAVIGFGITFLIPKKYASTAIVYPYNSYSKSDIIANPQFGFEVETEQLMQLLESATMRERTIEKFKLYEYYELDTNQRDWSSKITLNYIEDVNFFRSKYLSVVINVTTRDPELSAKIANFQVSEVDTYRQSIFEANRKQEMQSREQEYRASEERLRLLRDSIYSIKTNKQQLLYNFIENLNNEDYLSDEFVDDPALEELVDQYIFLYRKNAELRKVWHDARRLMDEPLPSVYLIDKATPSYKKVSPSFMLNTLIASFLMLALAICGKLLVSKWRELKQG